MSAGLMIEVSGTPIDLNDATWYMVAPCGCTSGATIAYSPPFLNGEPHVVVTAEQAWREFYETTAERNKYQRLGFTIELGLRSEITERMSDGGCKHEPRYGYSIPQPEGMEWAVGGYYGRRTSVLHLVAAEVVADGEKCEGYVAATALCGQSQHHWSSEWHIADGKVECSRCMKAAS